MTELLIHDATIVSIDPVIGTLDRADILIRDDIIVAIGPDLVAPAAAIVEARGMIAIPGFVDSHLHGWEGQLRGAAPATDFAGYLGLTAFGFGPLYRPEDNYAGTLLTAVTALDAGITTVVDNSHNALSLDHSAAAVQALLDVGIRGVHAVGSPFGSQLAHVPATAISLRDRFAGPLLSVRLFDIDPGPELWRFARDEGFWMSTEFGPHTSDLVDRVRTLHDSGLFTPEHALNHCYDLPEIVWKIIGDSGAVVNLCPRSDASYGLGSAVPPVAAALRYAAGIGLSNDNETSYGINMFAEMQTLLLRHRGEGFRARALGGDAEVDDITPSDLLEFATLGGARNAGLSSVTGSLCPGKQADIVLIAADSVNTLPCIDPVATVTSIAHPGSVDTVVVAGRIHKRHGRLVGVDLDAVRSLVAESRRYLVGVDLDAVRSLVAESRRYLLDVAGAE